MRKPLLAALVPAACGDPSPAGFSTGPVATTAPASTGASSTGGGTTTTGPADDSAGPGSAEDGMSTGVLRDVGTDDDFGPAQPEGWAGWGCEEFGCPDFAPNCGPDAKDYQCYVYPKLITPCDYTLGAGLIFNAGDGAANRQCALFGGNRYIVSGEPDMNDALECIAKVGWNGGIPPMGDALIAALAPKINAEGGCNAGFLRNDALLVVAFISDIIDEESTSWPYQQYDAILAVKKDPNAVVMLGVVPQPLAEGAQEIPGCTYQSDIINKGKIRDLIDRFPYRAYGDTCAPSYAPFFDQATDLIGEVCGKFVPQ